MNCPLCNEDRIEKDFYGKDECYKCVYKKKLMNLSRFRKCKMCGKQLQKDKWAYCGNKCAIEGKIKHRIEYWTNQI